MKNRRNVALEKTTVEKLVKLRITSRETYDEVMGRLIKEHEKNAGKQI